MLITNINKGAIVIWLLLLLGCSSDDCGYVKDHIIEGNTYYFKIEHTDFKYDSKREVSKEDYYNYNINDYYCK